MHFRRFRYGEVSTNIRINVGPFIHNLIFCTPNSVFTFNLSMHLSSQNRFSSVITNIYPNFGRIYFIRFVFSSLLPTLYSHSSVSLFIVFLFLYFFFLLLFLSLALIWHANGSIFLTSFVILLPFWWLLYTDRWQCLGSLSVSYVNAHKTQNMAAIWIKSSWS